jgi:hypothetical protein
MHFWVWDRRRGFSWGKGLFFVKEAFTVNQSNNIHTRCYSLPHRRLYVYKKSLELLAAVRAAQVADAKLRDEALRAAKGVCLTDCVAAVTLAWQ